MSFPFLGFSVFILFKSWGESEKIAISVPDVKAEQNKRITIPIRPIIRL